MPSFASRLRAGERLLGMQCFTGSPHLVEAMAVAGFDHVMIDTEHTAFSIAEAVHLIRAADSFRIAPLVRVHAPYAPNISKALDAGAAGVVVPRVVTPDDMRAALDAAFFPPLGQRGMCPDTRGARYSFDGWLAHARGAQSEIAVIPLIEDVAALAHIDAICAMEGVHAVFFGPGDYGVSLGAVAEGFSERIRQETWEGLTMVAAACRRHGKALMATPLFGLDKPDRAVAGLFDVGVTAVMYSIDSLLFQGLARNVAAAFRRQADGHAVRRPVVQ